jgi:hypothetical protein
VPEVPGASEAPTQSSHHTPKCPIFIENALSKQEALI